MDVKIITDASQFVRESIEEVTHEMAIAGLLVGLIVMLMLGSWRPMVVVTTSIPLCILTSLIFLEVLGESMNVMTPGGLALAVGILVDDATVMIENIDTHLEMGKELDEAIINAANQIVIPTLLATLCICIVWLPLFTLSGVSSFLFKPMALAVIFAMLPSFILSRTLVPPMAKYLIKHPHAEEHKKELHHSKEKPAGRFAGFQQRLKHLYEDFLPFSGGIRDSLSPILWLVWRVARLHD